MAEDTRPLQMTVLWELPRMNSFLIRVDPTDTTPQEPFGDRYGPDESFWDIDMHVGDRKCVRLKTVRRELQAQYSVQYGERLSKVRTEATLLWVLMHPQSPWGVGWRCQDGILFNTNPLAGWNMMVIYRGSWFSRDQRGALEFVEKLPRWLDAEDYEAIIEQVRREAS